MPNFPYKITTIFIFSIFVAVVFVSCNEVESTYKYPEPQPQSSIIGSWKLKYFVDVENNTKREPYISKWIEHMDSLGFQYDYEKTMKNIFILTFFAHKTSQPVCDGPCPIPTEELYFVNGSSCANNMWGNYFIDYNTKKLTTYIMHTLALNSLVPDGHLYEKIVRKNSFTFKLFSDTLLLYYNNDKECLEFYKTEYIKGVLYYE